MKKIFVLMMMAFTMIISFVSCATTSAVSNKTVINESKLTNISYVKRMFHITNTIKKQNRVIYILDNNIGFYTKEENKDICTTVCMVVKDGELYGSQRLSNRGAGCLFNLHDNRCLDYETQIPVDGYVYYYTHDESNAELFRSKMLKLATECGLIER